MYYFNIFDGGVSCFYGFKFQCGVDYLFQFVMIVFNYVVLVFNLLVFNVRWVLVFVFEQSKCVIIGGCFICVDELWDLLFFYVVEDFIQKLVCSFVVMMGGEIKIDSVVLVVDGLVQICLVVIDFYVGFIYVLWVKIGRVMLVLVQLFFYFRCIMLNLVVNCGVIDIYFVFSQYFLQFMVIDVVFVVLVYGLQNDVMLKMLVFEWVYVQFYQ